MATTTSATITPLERQLLAQCGKLELQAAAEDGATVVLYDRGGVSAKYGQRYVAKLVARSGMVVRETYPSNDLAIIAERLARW